MAVTFTAAGASALVTEGSTGSPSPGLPATPSDYDLFLLWVTSADNVAHTVTAGWTQAFKASNGIDTQVSLWYAWYKTTSPNSSNGEINAAPTITHSGTNACAARIAGFRGAIPSGSGVNPVDVISTSLSATGVSLSTAGLTPTYDTGVVVHFFGAGTANTANALSGAGGITVACLAATNTASNATGRACLGAYYKAGTLSSVATGTATATMSAAPRDAATGWAAIQVVIKPAYAQFGTGAVHIRQIASNENSTGSSVATLTAVMANPVLAGSYLLAIGGYYATGQTLTVADNVNAGNYTLLDTCTDAINSHLFSSYGKAATAAGTPTATLTVVASEPYLSLLFVEIANVNSSTPLLAHVPNYQSAPTTATDAVTTGSMTVTAGNNLIIGVSQSPGTQVIPTAGTGFTSAGTYGPNTAWGNIESERVTSGTSLSATFTIGTSGPTETFGFVFSEIVTGSSLVLPTTDNSVFMSMNM
jgi:hypothetical protein